jgi:hypothetical protein
VGFIVEFAPLSLDILVREFMIALCFFFAYAPFLVIYFGPRCWLVLKGGDVSKDFQIFFGKEKKRPLKSRAAAAEEKQQMLSSLAQTQIEKEEEDMHKLIR